MPEASPPNQKRPSRVLRWALALSVAALAFWVLFREVDAQQFVAALTNVQLGWFAVAVLCQLGCHLFRTFRFGAHLQPLKPVGFGTLLSINTVSALAINLLPFRTGELVRPALLTEREDVSFSKGLALTLVDRMHDVVGLAALFVAVIAWAPLPTDVVSVAGVELAILADGRSVIALAVVLFGAATALPLVLGARGDALVLRFLGKRIGALYASYRNGLAAVGTPRALSLASAWNVVLWLLFIASLWALLRAFGLDSLGLWAAAVVTVFLHIGLLLPAPPGLAGVFEAFVAGALVFYGTDASAAAAYAVVLHVVQFAVLIPLALFFLWRDGLTFRHILKLSRAPKPADG